MSEQRRASPYDVAQLVDPVREYAVVGLDADGHVQTWNETASRLVGWPAEQVLGQHISTFYTAEDTDAELPERLLEEARQRGSVQYSGRRLRADGTPFWIDVTLTALTGDEGEMVGFTTIIRDVTTTRDLEQSLRRSQERLRLLIEQVVDYAIIGLDVDGTIELWNSGAARLKGYREQEALGQHFSIFYPAVDRDAGLPQRLLAAALRDGRVQHSGWRVRADGSHFWGDVTLTAIHDTTGRHTGFAKVTRDRSEAHDLEQARESFLATLAHDFRGPLTSIVGYAELLEDSEAQRDPVNRIRANAQRLSHMSDQLLEHSRAEAGAGPTPVQVAWLDVLAVARRTVESLGPVVPLDRVRVAPGEAVALADPAAVERIVTNLVINAVRYSQDGMVEVRAEVRADGTCVDLVVADSGRGIAGEDLGRITEPYHRGRMAVDGDGGLGLGLSSVARLVEQSRGSLDIRSELGVGTTVTVGFPLG